MEKEEVQPGVLTVNDPLGELLDIISFNEYVAGTMATLRNVTA